MTKTLKTLLTGGAAAVALTGLPLAAAAQTPPPV
jgi:hypothetical protein